MKYKKGKGDIKHGSLARIAGITYDALTARVAEGRAPAPVSIDRLGKKPEPVYDLDEALAWLRNSK